MVSVLILSTTQVLSDFVFHLSNKTSVAILMARDPLVALMLSYICGDSHAFHFVCPVTKSDSHTSPSYLYMYIFHG